MSRATDLILSRLHADLDVERLALELDMSPSYFRSVFRRTFGQSARSMHRQARMREGCSLLVYQNQSINTIAETLGFCAVHNFARAFKDVIGVSPGAYGK